MNWSREHLSIIEYRHRVRHHNEAGNLKTPSRDSLVHWPNTEWSWKDDSGRKGWMSPPWVRVLGVIRNAGVLSGCACEQGRLRVYGSPVPSYFPCRCSSDWVGRVQTQVIVLDLGLVRTTFPWVAAAVIKDDDKDLWKLDDLDDGVLGEAGGNFRPEFASFWKSKVSAQRVTYNWSFINGGEVLTAVLDPAITETMSAT